MTLLFLLPIVIPEIREQAMDAVMAQAPTTVALSILTLCGGIAVVYHLFKK